MPFVTPADVTVSVSPVRHCPLVADAEPVAALTAAEAAQELGLSKRRIYELRSDYLKAYAQGQQRTWTPGYSGGDHSVAWPENVVQLLRRRLSSNPPSSYSFAASEAMRLYGFRLDRAQVRHWARRHGLAHSKPVKKERAPVRRWQRQRLGELWQLDASPHAWFPGDPTLYPMLNPKNAFGHRGCVITR